MAKPTIGPYRPVSITIGALEHPIHSGNAGVFRASSFLLSPTNESDEPGRLDAPEPVWPRTSGGSHMVATGLSFSVASRARIATETAFRNSDLNVDERALVTEFVDNHLRRTEDGTCCPACSEYAMLLAIEYTIGPITDAEFHRLMLIIDAPRRAQ
jgi:hypothetical protein